MSVQKGTGIMGWLEKHASKHKTRNSLTSAAAKAMHCSERQARDGMGRLVKQGRMDKRFAADLILESKTSSVVKKQQKNLKVPIRFKAGVNVAIVKEEYNDEGRILKGIENLGDQVIKDNDFRQELSIPNDRWRVVSGKEKFSKNKIELKGKQFRGVYWGSENIVNELCKAVDML